MHGVAIGRAAKVLRRPWYATWRAIERRLFLNREYSLHIPYGDRIYTPWFDTSEAQDFSRIIQRTQAAGRLGVSLDRCFVLYLQARIATRRYPGKPMAECGVYTGGTAQVIAHSASLDTETPAPLFLFDTFEGMPETSVPDRDYHRPGDFADTSLSAVQERLRDLPMCHFHPGFIPKTFSAVAEVSDYSLIHVDVDIYPSVIDCLEWFWPRMVSGGTIIVDDYGFYPYRNAARRAVDEFLESTDALPWPLPTGQAVITKL